MSTLFLCGAGNAEGVRLALAVNRANDCWARIALLDDDVAKLGRELIGIPVVGPISALAAADATRDAVVSLVTRTCDRRAAMHAKIAPFGVPFASLVHPGVDIVGADLAPGTTVYGGATIGPESRVETGSVVFMGAVVGHEASVGEGCVIAANAVLNARVRLGARVYVGSNATIVPEVSVGAGATIGVGSAVLQDVPAAATALGVPAAILYPRGAGASSSAGSLGRLTGEDDVSRAELRRIVAEVWRDVLQANAIGDDQNFFDLGGTSLLACRLADRTREATGYDVHLLDVFRFPTVRALAEHLRPRPADGLLAGAARRAQLRRELHRH